jgi:hypothetical protein
MNTQPGDITHGYQLEQWTQHWRQIDGAWYRDAVAIRLADGQRRLISFLDDTL